MALRIRMLAALVAAALVAAALGAASAAAEQARKSSRAQASAVPERGKADRTSVTTDGPAASNLPDGVSHGGHQHGGDVGHLPPTSRNVKLLSKLELDGEFGNVRPGQIADVGTHRGYAYLNSWQDELARTCERGGVFVVDIRNPRKPKEIGFIHAMEGSYPGEGNQVIRVKTPFFKGDLLTINSEACAGSGAPATRRGGITLVDVTNPRKPVKLAENFGDITPPSISAAKTNPEHLTHSAFSWQDGDRAYTVMVDNEEFEDVDIVDITNPRAPVLIRELDLTTLSDLGTAFGNLVNLHDMVVKEIAGKQIMLLSYWDGGYAMLDVDDPANPVFLGDTDFAACDPLKPAFCPPEGNAHQAEFSRDNRFFLATDEDFAPFRLSLQITSGPNAGQQFNAGDPIDASANISDLDDRTLAPSTRFFGRGCNGDPQAAPPADDGNPSTERIALIERGLCTFEQKVDNAEAAGYDGYLIFNNAGRPDGDPLVTNGVLGNTPLPGGFIERSTAMRIFGGSIPAAPGADGADVSVTPRFDGWGYMHLYDAQTLQDVDQYAIPESQDERFASGFGDLSIHEVATDPREDLGYISYYAGGFRVVSYGPGGLEEVGAFIDEGGNNFWGVQVADRRRKGRAVVLASDRDYGLYVFQYTGPLGGDDGDDESDDDSDD
jgi:hypothetical protein